MALYDAFVSHSHVKDKPIAAALQRSVQTLGKPWYQRGALRVFRDDTSLSATPHLWPTIEGRGWRGFHHHATLCIAAYGFLVSERETIPPSGTGSARPFKEITIPETYRARGSAIAA
jgi:hypothetical protein